MHGAAAALIFGEIRFISEPKKRISTQFIMIALTRMNRQLDLCCVLAVDFLSSRAIAVCTLYLHLSTGADRVRRGRGLPGGVTRAMNITYLRPCPIPSTTRIESKVVQQRRSASLVTGSITSLDKKLVYFICEHHKIEAPIRIQRQATVDEKSKTSSRL
jgi:hypothetical protein